MKKLLAISALAALLAAGCNQAASAPSGGGQAQAASPAAGTKLSDEPYANYAYEVDPNNLSAQAKQALAGFTVSSKALDAGDTQITLAATGNPEYHTQVYTLKPGQKLYFIEKSWGDDGGDKDFSYGDDTAVVVDQNGYVVPRQ